MFESDVILDSGKTTVTVVSDALLFENTNSRSW